MTRQPLKDRILTAAYALFDEHGIRHTSVDSIAREAETTKMGVYRHFSSRDELVDSWLTATIARYKAVLDEVEARFEGDPRSQLIGWADHIADSLVQISHRGCPFVNTIAEIPDRENPLRRKIEAHKVNQARRIESICREAGVRDPEVSAAEITFLLEGAQISAQNGSVRSIEQHIRAIMSRILRDTED